MPPSRVVSAGRMPWKPASLLPLLLLLLVGVSTVFAAPNVQSTPSSSSQLIQLLNLSDKPLVKVNLKCDAIPPTFQVQSVGQESWTNDPHIMVTEAYKMKSVLITLNQCTQHLRNTLKKLKKSERSLSGNFTEIWRQGRCSPESFGLVFHDVRSVTKSIVKEFEFLSHNSWGESVTSNTREIGDWFVLDSPDNQQLTPDQRMEGIRIFVYSVMPTIRSYLKSLTEVERYVITARDGLKKKIHALSSIVIELCNNALDEPEDEVIRECLNTLEAPEQKTVHKFWSIFNDVAVHYPTSPWNNIHCFIEFMMSKSTNQNLLAQWIPRKEAAPQVSGISCFC